MATGAEHTPVVTVIVPTLNEAGNIEPLLGRLGRAFDGVPFAVLFVDDSDDDTPAVIRAAAGRHPFPIGLIARPPGERNGLSGAVVRGLAEVPTGWACVMDGDLQHPPELVPQMLTTAQKTGADLVVASRRASALGPQGLSLWRTLTSQGLTILARALFPRSLKDVSDPLTGFFLVRRERIALERLAPDGFKILLEILVRCPHMRLVEVLFDFGARRYGDSKAGVREGLRFFRHLWRLRLTAHQRPLGRYLAVGGTSFVLNLALFWGLIVRAGWPALGAAIIATEISDLWTYWGNQRFVFFQDEEADRRVWRFVGINQIFLFFFKLPLLFLLMAWGNLDALPAYVLAIGGSAAGRYLLSDRWIWTRDLLHRDRPLFAYDLHGLIAIESGVPLPTLAWFQRDVLDRPADLVIRLDRHGTPRTVREGVTFDDGLGRLGFGVTVQTGPEFVEVVVSPLVQRSPFVLVSNIVEPLLRWLCAHRSVALVQAGGVVEENGEVTLITHPSRSVITGAVLARLENAPHPVWLGHDLVFVNADGRVLAFPRPLTLNKRLERPSVRRVGAALRRLHVPVATLNILVQRWFPPRQLLVSDFVPGATIAATGPMGKIQVLGDDGRPAPAADPPAALLGSGRDPYGFPLLALLSARRKEGSLEEDEAAVLAAAWRTVSQQSQPGRVGQQAAGDHKADETV